LLRQLISSYKTLPEKKKKQQQSACKIFILDLYCVESSLTRSFQKTATKGYSYSCHHNCTLT